MDGNWPTRMALSVLKQARHDPKTRDHESIERVHREAGARRKTDPTLLVVRWQKKTFYRYELETFHVLGVPAGFPVRVGQWFVALAELETFIAKEGRWPRENNRATDATITLEERRSAMWVRTQHRRWIVTDCATTKRAASRPWVVSASARSKTAVSEPRRLQRVRHHEQARCTGSKRRPCRVGACGMGGKAMICEAKRDSAADARERTRSIADVVMGKSLTSRNGAPSVGQRARLAGPRVDQIATTSRTNPGSTSNSQIADQIQPTRPMTAKAIPIRPTILSQRLRLGIRISAICSTVRPYCCVRDRYRCRYVNQETFRADRSGRRCWRFSSASEAESCGATSC